MDRYSLKKLEFHKIKEMLESDCRTPLGPPLVRALEPSSDPVEIGRWQEETSEAATLLRILPSLGFEGISDLTPQLRRAAIGGVLEPRELLLCRQTLAVAERIKQELAGYDKEQPCLQGYASGIDVCEPLQERIDACVLPDGEVADSASPELARLRRQIRDVEARARSQLDDILSKPEWLRFLQEPLYTVRGDRYVVPVKQEYRSHFPGLVHDQSGSGATVFMEPLPLVNLMNDLAAARGAAHAEELRILEQLSGLVAAYQDELRTDMELLALLDFTFAKGRLSLRQRGRQPAFGDDRRVDLRGGRHPLLQGEVVPVDLKLGKDFDCLVITGPNTGGKTVALKTLGLLILMAQAGLHIPAGEGTVLPFFNNVYADIGDEQSIEQSLSTFSGHMKNIVHILQGVSGSTPVEQRPGQLSLVLLDELGAGTDPEQGAALGMAILLALMQLGALVMASTHYSELKLFAYSEERAENASVEFDSKTLRPTYRLITGVPGESNAFEVAGSLGLQPEVLSRARGFLSPEQRQLADLIRQLREDQAAASEARREAEHLSAEARQLQARHKEEEERLRQRERDTLAKATQEAQELVRMARSEAEQLIRALREEQRRSGLDERRQAALVARSKLSALSEQIEERVSAITPVSGGEPPDGVKIGDPVFIPRFNTEGCVLEEQNSGGDVLVQVGALKVTLPVKELRKTARSQQERSFSFQSPSLEQAAGVSTELHLRGLRVEDALEQVDKYLDTAYLAGLPRVSLIHGKGTGALRDALRRYLAQHPFVDSFRSGGHYEGGTGVTVVTFK